MNEIKKLIKDAELLKEEMIILNYAYDDLFKPWILVDNNSRSEDKYRDVCVHNESKDLDLLYKLQSVLTQAYGVNKVPTKTEVVRISEKKVVVEKKIMPVTKIQRVTPAVVLPLSKVNQRTRPPDKRVFVPAHVSAPFKTNPNLHRRISRPNYSIKRPTTTNITISTTSSTTSTHGTDQKTVSKHNDTHIQDSLPKNIVVKKDEEGEDVVVADNNKSWMFSQLGDEIKKLEEKEPGQEDIARKMCVRRTIFEAGTDLQVPKNLKKEMVSHSKWQSKIDRVFLHNMKPETALRGYKARQRFLEALLVQRGPMTVDNHRVTVLDAVLDKLAIFCDHLDLASCNPRQLSFLRSCFSWASSELVSLRTVFGHCTETHMSEPSSSSSQNIRQWLDARSKTGGAMVGSMWDRVAETATITNGCYLSGVNDRGTVTLSIARAHTSPLAFSLADTLSPVIVPSVSECRSRELSLQLQMDVCWGPLLRCWAQQLQDKYHNGDNPCAFYRQLYGLLLHKSPVLLHDVS